MSSTVHRDEIDLTQAGALGDRLFTELNKLRESDPIHWNEAAECWVVTRHQDIVDAFSGRLPLSNVRQAKASYAVIPAEEWPARLPTLVKYSPHHITNMDAPRHTLLRKLLTKAFGRPVVERLRPYARSKVAELMRFMESHERVEFNEDVGFALPGSVILKLLDMPEELFPHLRTWARDVMVGLGNPHPKAEWVEAADRAFFEMTRHFADRVADRRRHPRGYDDFISALVLAKEGDSSLTDEEIIGVLQVALVAGHDTTSNSMTLGVAALAAHPESWRYFREHPERSLDSVLELMRYTAMAAAQNRVASADFEWSGRRIKKGDVVFLMQAAGNRDPRAYDRPEELDLSRKNDASLTFAPGLHHCIGHLLAKMQLIEFFSALTDNFDGAEILDDEVTFSPILVFRSIPSLHMRFHARRR
jgi:pimeloyl-[acyl-carrier protein] synthase